jgi:hypothetical protein
MNLSTSLESPQLPPAVQGVLDDFLQSAKNSLEDTLQSVVLYGSAVNAAFSPTSDLNLIFILTFFEKEKLDELRSPLRVAQAAVQVHVMFLLGSEIPAAVRSFAPKFAGILRRRAILYGEDPFSEVTIPRDAEIHQLKQQLLNITLRLRAAYVSRSLREEQLIRSIVHAVGPLRACAAVLLALEGRSVVSPQLAFERLAAELSLPDSFLSALVQAQQARLLPSGAAEPLFFQLLEFSIRSSARVEALSSEVPHEPF